MRDDSSTMRPHRMPSGARAGLADPSTCQRAKGGSAGGGPAYVA
jgi:hypothetical protein